MARFEDKGQLTIKKQTFVVEDVLDSLRFLPGKEVASFFADIRLSIPRKIRITVLKNVLRDSVQKTKNERASLADEVSYRLLWFERFTDTQLVNLLEFYRDNNLSKNYLLELWRAILGYFIEKGVSEGHILGLLERSFEAKVNAFLVDTKTYNEDINSIFYDYEGEIDGLTPEEFRPVTYKSSTLTELRYIGDKYNANVPKRLKKKELLEIMLEELKKRGEWTLDLENKLKTKSILVLERYCKDNGIKISTELRKEEIIEYILANAKETQAVYYAPASSAVYEEIGDDALEEASLEAEPVIEAPLVTDEPADEVVEEKVTVYQSAGIDYSHILEKIYEEIKLVNERVSKMEKTETQRFIVEEQENPEMIVTKSQTSYISKETLLKRLLQDEVDDF